MKPSYDPWVYSMVSSWIFSGSEVSIGVFKKAEIIFSSTGLLVRLNRRMKCVLSVSLSSEIVEYPQMVPLVSRFLMTRQTFWLENPHFFAMTSKLLWASEKRKSKIFCSSFSISALLDFAI